jgi:hypothetical protein
MRDNLTSSRGPRQCVYVHTWMDSEPATAVKDSRTETIRGCPASAGSGFASAGFRWGGTADDAHTHIQ